MYNHRTVSVVMSTFNERESIRQCINDFFSTNIVDEVIIVDNNATKGTREEVERTSANLYTEPRQGYGWGYRKALEAATGDLLIMCEPDGTFIPSDIEKLLAYSDHMDVVQGSRTSSTLILDGANMGLLLKYGNFLVAKLAEFSFPSSATSLSDCGCTFRLLSRSAYQILSPHFRTGGSAFGMEITLLCLRSSLPMCEIPIRYSKRVGQSSVTGRFLPTLLLALEMIFLTFRHRVEEFFKPLSGT